MANLYSILDVKASMFGPIISFQNDMTAIRAFTEMIVSGDKNSMLALYPSDYVLCLVGKFNQESGLVENISQPVHIVTGFEAFSRAVSEAELRRKMRERLEKGNLDVLPSLDINTLGRDDVPSNDINTLGRDDVPSNEHDEIST